MFPTESHMNMGGSIHGGAVMSFIDMALFAGGRCAGMAEGHYVTLDLHHPFPRPRPGRHAARRACRAGAADAQSLVFMQGIVRQDGEPCYSFTGTLKRIRDRNAPA